MQGTCRVCKTFTDLLEYRRRDRICRPCRSAEQKREGQKRRGTLGWGRAPCLTREERRLRSRVGNATRYLVSIGALSRGPCEVCGSPKAHAHHDDYTKPREVRWLCVTHHHALHKRLRSEAKAAYRASVANASAITRTTES